MPFQRRAKRRRGDKTAASSATTASSGNRRAPAVQFEIAGAGRIVFRRGERKLGADDRQRIGQGPPVRHYRRNIL